MMIRRIRNRNRRADAGHGQDQAGVGDEFLPGHRPLEVVDGELQHPRREQLKRGRQDDAEEADEQLTAIPEDEREKTAEGRAHLDRVYQPLSAHLNRRAAAVLSSGGLSHRLPGPLIQGAFPNHSGARRLMRTRVAAISVLCLAFGLTATPARAQSSVKGPSDAATGERYHVEIGGFLWDPTPDIVIEQRVARRSSVPTSTSSTISASRRSSSSSCE